MKRPDPWAAGFALLAAVGVLWFASACGGIRAPVKPSTGSGFNLYYHSDTHAGALWGGRVYGMVLNRAIVQYINADPDAAALIHGGDLTWYAAGKDTAAIDSLMWEYQENLRVPYYPTIGNWEWTQRDSGTSQLYNQFTGHFPHLYKQFVSAEERGARWYGRRLTHEGAPTNVLLVSMNNVKEAADAGLGSPAYRVNNPDDGGGFSNVDFDGISDSTSAQRVAIRRFIQSNRKVGDWVVVVGHRTERGLAAIESRPDLENSTTGEGVYKALDDLIPAGWLLLQGDEHIHSFLDQTTYGTGPGHWTISSVQVPRGIDRARAATHTADILLVQAADSTYCGGCALEDSLGVQAELKDPFPYLNNNTYTVLWQLSPNGNTMAVSAILFQYADATVQVYTKTVTQ